MTPRPWVVSFIWALFIAAIFWVGGCDFGRGIGTAVYMAVTLVLLLWVNTVREKK